jgi:PAT family beta-lactamase induction signal transducer AmpG
MLQCSNNRVSYDMTDTPKARWADRRLWIMLALGFAGGLPLPLSGLTLRQWMSEGHVTLVLIGLTGSLGLSYSLKFLWSPVLDRPAPSFLRRFGRRRGWLLTLQPLLALSIVGLALSDPLHGITAVLVLGGVIAFLSASQDIAIDAWRIETFAPARQGAALAAYVWGYRVALLLGGSGAIALATPLGWHRSLLVIAGAALIGPTVTLLAPEPILPLAVPAEGSGWLNMLKAAFAAPLREFFTRRGALLVVAYVMLFKLGEAMAGVMLTPFYRSLGFDRAAVAIANGPASLVASVCGYAVGGLIVARIGLGRALIATGFAQMAAMAMYLGLALSAGNHVMLIGTTVTESFMEGIADAAFLTFLSTLCAPAFTATQYALLSSLATVPLRTIGGLAGATAAAVGWLPFYSLAMAASLPAMGVMLLILRRGDTRDASRVR